MVQLRAVQALLESKEVVFGLLLEAGNQAQRKWLSSERERLKTEVLALAMARVYPV
jgi:hypothetical protein